MLLTDGLDADTIRDCLRLAAKREALAIQSQLRTQEPWIVFDKWLSGYTERRAFELMCKQHGVDCGGDHGR